MPTYQITYTAMLIEAEDEEQAIDRALESGGGGSWEAEEVDMSSTPEQGHGAGPYQTLGHIAAEVRRMKMDGVTRESIEYVLDQTYGTPATQHKEMI